MKQSSYENWKHIAVVIGCSALLLVMSDVSFGAELSIEAKNSKVRSCVMDYIQKNAAHSNRSVEAFFESESKLVYITLNSCLKEQGLPEVDMQSETVSARLTYDHGAMGDALLGFSVEDGKKRYCFPCVYSDKVSEWGVLPPNFLSSIRKPASFPDLPDETD